MSMSFIAATAAALTIFQQAAPVQCVVPTAPTPMATVGPVLPERPACVTAEGENNCTGNEVEEFNVAAEAFNAAAAIWQPEYRAYMQQIRDYQQAVLDYGTCENERVLPPHLRPSTRAAEAAAAAATPEATPATEPAPQ